MVRLLSPDGEGPRAVGRMIARALARCEAMNLRGLSRALALDEQTVAAEIETMVEDGEVERLRPIGSVTPERDFFRWDGARQPGERRGRPVRRED